MPKYADINISTEKTSDWKFSSVLSDMQQWQKAILLNFFIALTTSCYIRTLATLCHCFFIVQHNS